jgi:hypothetical protein
MSTEDKLDEFRAWVAGRKAAAARIDIETCNYWCERTWILDPYGLYHAEARAAGQEDPEDNIGKVLFVGAPDSDGPIADDDLSEEQDRALSERMKREEGQHDNEVPY